MARVHPFQTNFTAGELTPKLAGQVDFKKYNNIILEASSHALDQDRFNGIRFNTSGFTNLSQDHFDYHTNIENYFNSKLKLFSNQLSDKYVYIDNEWGNKVAQNSSLPSFKISSDTQADLQILEKKTYPKTSLKIETVSYTHLTLPTNREV